MNKKIFYISIIGILMISFSVIYYFAFIYDIGLRGDYFARRDFNNAFQFRQTGNCDKFGLFIMDTYSKEWFNRCLDEKNRRNDYVPINEFTLKEVSFNGDQAFLQVELIRDMPAIAKVEDNKYIVNYEMKRIKENNKLLGILPQTKFLINQGINK